MHVKAVFLAFKVARWGVRRGMRKLEGVTCEDLASDGSSPEFPRLLKNFSAEALDISCGSGVPQRVCGVRVRSDLTGGSDHTEKRDERNF